MTPAASQHHASYDPVPASSQHVQYKALKEKLSAETSHEMQKIEASALALKIANTIHVKGMLDKDIIDHALAQQSGEYARGVLDQYRDKARNGEEGLLGSNYPGFDELLTTNGYRAGYGYGYSRRGYHNGYIETTEHKIQLLAALAQHRGQKAEETYAQVLVQKSIMNSPREDVRSGRRNAPPELGTLAQVETSKLLRHARDFPPIDEGFLIDTVAERIHDVHADSKRVVEALKATPEFGEGKIDPEMEAARNLIKDADMAYFETHLSNYENPSPVKLSAAWLKAEERTWMRRIANYDFSAEGHAARISGLAKAYLGGVYDRVDAAEDALKAQVVQKHTDEAVATRSEASDKPSVASTLTKEEKMLAINVAFQTKNRFTQLMLEQMDGQLPEAKILHVGSGTKLQTPSNPKYSSGALGSDS